MFELVGDRFVRAGAAWIDLATGASVRVRTVPSGNPSEQLAWSDRCAALSVLRHPLINPLVDYGAAGSRRRFEAYAVSPPLGVRGPIGAALLAHAARFVEAAGVPLAPAQAAMILRSTTAAAQRRLGRPVGVVLQQRRVLIRLMEALVDARSGGLLSLRVTGVPGCGLRTLGLLVARAARLEGYVPLSLSLLARWPGLLSFIGDRHVCLLADEHRPRSEQPAAARVLSELGIRSTRRHVLIRFTRTVEEPRSALVVESMGVTTMMAMVFVDSQTGPRPEELWSAARSAQGSPGRFLECLRASRYPEPVRGPLLVHESRAEYEVLPSAGVTGRRRPNPSCLVTAPSRASRLAARGRHAAAMRLLQRAVRVFEARGDHTLASSCAAQLAWTLRDRGRSADAAEQFHRARSLAQDEADRIRASVGIGVAWTDEMRLPEAEACLRAAGAAADVVGDAVLAARAGLALARCLFWQRRFDEALELLDRMKEVDVETRVEALALAARARLELKEYRPAMAAASEAASANACGPRHIALACRALALVQAALGDATGARASVRRGLAASIPAHLPLLTLRLRAALLGCSESPSIDRACLLLPIRTALTRRALPPLLRTELQTACSEHEHARAHTPVAHVDAAMSQLHALLDLSHRSPDDRTAAERICAALLEGLRAATVQLVAGPPDAAVLARAGRPWQGELLLADRVLADGSATPADAIAHSLEAAAAVRYGDEPIAAVICRWTPGTALDAVRARALVRAGALAAAAPVRGLLDRRQVQGNHTAWPDLIGTSPPVVALRESIARAARAPFPVLVEGESGSGKELVARAIHRHSPRRERRLCAINCAALSDDLLEAELFGHARGAYTGAVGERPGLFEEADGGTLFLDEIGELSARAQAKLLRVLQDGEVRRVGENLPRRVDTRIIAATNRCLEQEVERGRFRTDLRYRLDVIRIQVPPLRDRASDIPALAAHFWEEATRRIGSRATLAPDTLSALTRYDWPGNVRELQNAIAAIAVHSPRRGRVTPAALPAHLARAALVVETTFDAARQEFERRYVMAALARSGGRRAGAARALGVTRQGLAKMLRRLRIEAGP